MILALLASSFALGGCGGSTQGNMTNAPQGPAPPVNLELSFPNGAPKLNQAAELRCVVKTPALIADSVTVNINLPDGLELISGNLSAQFGTMSTGDVKELRAVIKPAKVGNYTIEAKLSLASLNPTFHPGPGLYEIYLSVSESSAEWAVYPPWLKGKTTPTSVQVKKGDIEGVPSASDHEPPVEGLPPPPAVSP